MACEAIDDAMFAERLEAYCRDLCQWSPITLRLLKRGMVKSLERNDLEQQMRYELSNIRIAFASEDAKEARTAFFEKHSSVQGTLKAARVYRPLPTPMVVVLHGRPGRPPCTIALHDRQARRFLCADRKDLDTLGSDLSRLGVFQSSRGRAFPEERVVREACQTLRRRLTSPCLFVVQPHA
jgi:hypothetical protein